MVTLVFLKDLGQRGCNRLDVLFGMIEICDPGRPGPSGMAADVTTREDDLRECKTTITRTTHPTLANSEGGHGHDDNNRYTKYNKA